MLGNSWNDYLGTDMDDDGIGDDPYYILGIAGSIDYFPIFWDAPVVSISTPLSNQRFDTTSPDFLISIIEGIKNTTWYTTYDGNTWSTNFITTGLSG